jgi:hypothetical protein
MSKTEEIEGLRLALPQATTLGSGIGAKLDQARLVWMEGKTEAFETFPEVSKESFRLLLILESQDEVVSLAHDDNVTACVAASPLLCPQVQDIAKTHIGKQRRNHRPLRCTHRGLGPCSILGQASLEPFIAVAKSFVRLVSGEDTPSSPTDWWGRRLACP